MDPVTQMFCLRWNNHRNNLLSVLDQFLQTEELCDVTLACEGVFIKCHKMILSACSAYFQQIFNESPCEHPIVFLKDVKYDEIKAVLDYMYKGEVNVAHDQLHGLLKVAENLKVKGLVEEEREKLVSSAARANIRPADDVDRPRSASRNGSGNGNNNAPKTNGDINKESLNSPTGLPSATSSSSMPNVMRPFMYSQAPGAQFPMWPFPGLLPNPNLFNNRDGKNNDVKEEKDGSPSPKESQSVNNSGKRKKTASGSGSSSSRESLGSLSLLNNQEPPQNDANSRPLPDNEPNDDNRDALSVGSIANYVPGQNTQRLEWKRYKQYTRNDINAAIEEVKKGVSALQASRKYGVPSRTLYDKVKKMGITTGRQMQRKSLPAYSASFPSLQNISSVDQYKDIADRYKDMDDSTDSSHGNGIDNRATLVPHTGFSLQMLYEKLKENSKEEDSNFSPMNLSTMLSNRNYPRNDNKITQNQRSRLSDSSLSPNAEDMDEEDHIEDLENENRREEAESSTGGSRNGELRAQIMADLTIMGNRNIPTQSGNDEPHQTATSTTESPPPSSLSSHRSHGGSSEDNLPPRKRKLSQEHRLTNELSPPLSKKSSSEERSSPVNGGPGSPATSELSSKNSGDTPIKDESKKSVQCRN